MALHAANRKLATSCPFCGCLQQFECRSWRLGQPSGHECDSDPCPFQMGFEQAQKTLYTGAISLPKKPPTLKNKRTKSQERSTHPEKTHKKQNILKERWPKKQNILKERWPSYCFLVFCFFFGGFPLKPNRGPPQTESQNAPRGTADASDSARPAPGGYGAGRGDRIPVFPTPKPEEKPKRRPFRQMLV